MIVRFNKSALQTATKDSAAAIGVEGDPTSIPGKISEVEKIVGDAKRKVSEDGVPGVGVSGSNSGKGHDPKVIEERNVNVDVDLMEKVVEEEPGLVEGEGGAVDEMDVDGAEAASPETRTKLELPSK
jgi:protein phosphatase PTC1